LSFKKFSSDHVSHCECKDMAIYYTLWIGQKVARNAEDYL